MSPYASTYASLEPVEKAILQTLTTKPSHACSMQELLDALPIFDSSDVKSAVWHLIDQGSLRIESDRTLVAA